MRSVQELDPVSCHRDRVEILFHLSLQKAGSHLVQHVTELVICFREENRFIDPWRVLKGDELHGIAVLGLNGLAGDQPPDGGDLLAGSPCPIGSRKMCWPLRGLVGSWRKLENEMLGA